MGHSTTPAWIKRAAIREVREGRELRVDIARDLRLSPTCIAAWVKADIAAEQAEATRGPSPAELELRAVTARLAELEAENSAWRQAAAGALTRLQSANPGSGSAEAPSDAGARGLRPEAGISEPSPLGSIPVQPQAPEDLA
ncbi:hypothetical protein SAMN06264364_1494 [Quadrisphaera granulorum]|uniref:Transposase n=1 Tax=Quadrisphaera granulorum TaxID=317664 RepID=A0A315ZN29_9ACTN|nr:hypothetical protein [Quadrisphaera granulorum]PWJ46268.1 hypothetical protein BXY45_1494 [Quadrisphaera granulorum]SZE99083.1 hypothetical protein SAMN06264364_1494 [Quadrisphaera granulorum]